MLRLHLKASSSTNPNLEPRGDSLSLAVEAWELQNEELSRQIDAHFGINGERPNLVGPDPVPGGARVEEQERPP